MTQQYKIKEMHYQNTKDDILNKVSMSESTWHIKTNFPHSEQVYF